MKISENQFFQFFQCAKKFLYRDNFFSVNYQLSTINYQQSTINNQQSTTKLLLSNLGLFILFLIYILKVQNF